MAKIGKLICSVTVCLFTGFLGSFATRNSFTSWYAQLSRPSFTPPDWTFGVVWPILYVTMGISAFLIWNMGINRRQVKVALGVFALQLILNGLWTPIFFGLHLIGVALVEIVMMWAAILLTIFTFWKVSRSTSLALYTLGELCCCFECQLISLEQIKPSDASHQILTLPPCDIWEAGNCRKP